MSSVRRRAGRVLVTAFLLVGTMAACTVGPSERPPVAVRGTDLPVAPTTTTTPPPDPDVLPELEEQHTRIDYSDCTADILERLGGTVAAGRSLAAGCGLLQVPVDRDQPGLGDTRVGVLRIGSAGAPDTRPPLVVVGDSATDASDRHAASLAAQVPDDVLATFQLVGLDRRGSGNDLLDCAPADARAAIIDANPSASDETRLSGLLEQSRAVVQDCYLLLSGALSSYRTAATAGDLEQLRTALGVSRLNVLGVGDGAAAVASWASAHPGSVGRVVLDGPADLAADEPDLAKSRAASAEAAFDAFAASCTTQPGCPLGADPRGAVSALLTRLTTQPLAAADGDRLTAGAALSAIRAGLSEPSTWPALAQAIATAGNGDPTGLLVRLAPALGPQGSFDGALATTCNDTARRLTPPEVSRLAQDWRAEYPLFGASAAQQLLTCGPWPSVSTPTPPAALPPDAPPVLVLGTAADPRASQEGARRTAQLLARGRFVGWQGAGTGAYPRSACIASVVTAALVNGTLPRDGTVCPA
ncbi:MAG: alpha/beta hydrolase [Pseudonocardia sp.]|nr:alpha/beta hydrolase [Pseudonocardia sp.]